MMSELQLKSRIKDLEAETKRLYEERRLLINSGYDIRTHCPDGQDHDWSVIRVEDGMVFGGSVVRHAEFECACGATMSVSDGQPCVGGG